MAPHVGHHTEGPLSLPTRFGRDHNSALCIAGCVARSSCRSGGLHESKCLQRSSAHLHVPPLRSRQAPPAAGIVRQAAGQAFPAAGSLNRQPKVRRTQAHRHAMQPHALKGHLQRHSSCSCQHFNICFPAFASVCKPCTWLVTQQPSFTFHSSRYQLVTCVPASPPRPPASRTPCTASASWRCPDRHWRQPAVPDPARRRCSRGLQAAEPQIETVQSGFVHLSLLKAVCRAWPCLCHSCCGTLAGRHLGQPCFIRECKVPLMRGLRRAHCSTALKATASQPWCTARGCRLPEQSTVTRAGSCRRALLLSLLVPDFQKYSMTKVGSCICSVADPCQLAALPYSRVSASKEEIKRHQAHRQCPSCCWPPACWWCTL